MLGDWVEVSAVGNQAEQLLTRIPASRVQAVPGGFRCRVSLGQYRQILPFAERRGIELEIQKQGGMGVALAGYRSRYGLAVGLVVFAFLMVRFETVNWAVRYVGFTQAEQEIVAAALWENHLNEGQTVTQEKLRQAERQLMEQGSDFGWVTLNFTKGRLVAERTCAENTSPPPQSYQRHLVASTDALIVAMDVQGGFAQKQAGQTVTKGEVLVAATKVSRMGETVMQPTQGRVLGEFTIEYQASQPLREEKEIVTGQGIPWVRLQIGDHCFTVSGQENPGIGRVQRRGLTLAGFALPATIITTYYPVKEAVTLSLTPRAALEQAQYRCLCALYEQYPDAIIMTEKVEQKIRENVLEYCWKAKIRANIAIEGSGSAPISATDDEN